MPSQLLGPEPGFEWWICAKQIADVLYMKHEAAAAAAAAGSLPESRSWSVSAGVWLLEATSVPSP